MATLAASGLMQATEDAMIIDADCRARLDGAAP